MKEIICPLCNSKKNHIFLRNSNGLYFQKCSECSLVFRTNTLELSYEKVDWTESIDPDGNKKDLTKMKKFKMRNWYGQILEFIKKKKSGKILDVGCGLGYLLSEIPNSWEKHGYELSNYCKEFIKKNYSEIILESEIEPSIHNKNYYDVIICYHVIEHVDKPNIFFKKINSLLKKNGILIIGTPNMSSIAARIFRGNFRLLQDDGHITMFNEKNLIGLLRKHNYKVIQKEYPYFKTDYFNLRNIIKMFNLKNISPPFYGSIMTFYAIKNDD